MAPSTTLSTRVLVVTGVAGAAVIGAFCALFPDLAPAAVVLVFAAFACLLRARRVLLVMTTAAFLFGSSTLAVRDAAYYGRYVMLGLVAVTAALDWDGARPLGRVERRFATGLIGLGVLFLLSATWSRDPGVTLENSVGFLLLGVAVWSLLRGPWRDADAVRSDVTAVVATVVVLLAAGTLVWVTGSSDAALGDRVRGLLENPNTVGVAAALVLPVTLSLASVRRHGARAIWVAAFGLTALALVLSGSRGGVLAGVLGVLLMTLHAPAGRRWRIAGGAGLVVILVAVIALSTSSQIGGDSLTDRFRGTGDRDRRRAWSAAVEVWKDRPITGVGYAVGDELVVARALSDDEPFRGGTAFNGYLQTLVDVGPAGVFLVFLCLHSALRGWRRPQREPLESALLGAVAAGAALQMVEAGLTASGSVFAALFWMEAAALVALHFSVARGPHPSPAPSRSAA